MPGTKPSHTLNLKRPGQIPRGEWRPEKSPVKKKRNSISGNKGEPKKPR